MKTRVIGIDPAPSKKSALWEARGGSKRTVLELAAYLQAAERDDALLIVWDSPLSFAPQRSFSDRLIDKAARSWVKEQVEAERIEKGAVSVLHFSGCAHWPVSCYVLGQPFPSTQHGLRIRRAGGSLPIPGEALILESHPAVALAALWMEVEQGLPFPKYKNLPVSARAASRIAERLDFPPEAGRNDDTLDAYVSWRLGKLYLKNAAQRVGDLASGCYLLPQGPAATSIQERFDALLG